VVRWKAKVASSLTDVWQQLRATRYYSNTHHSLSPVTRRCMKTTPVHQRLETPTETDTQEHVYQKPVVTSMS